MLNSCGGTYGHFVMKHMSHKVHESTIGPNLSFVKELTSPSLDSSINLMHKRYLAYRKTGKIKSDVDLIKGY